ncbi:hypothetical protein AB1Y20_005275 [Prymnesium parvum]|uniref:Activator of Hsp90 ATPase AHSA1-like N-terminal domain-containing protein n=1 Tax=Prymnesium parvum TaxID=97485 RepID=A0AB34J5R4_PRYPA
MTSATAKPASAHLYWARNKSEDKVLTGEHKALTPEEAAALAAKSAGGVGAAWNKASTWEEKNIAAWAIGVMRDELLPPLAYELGGQERPLPASPLEAAVASCKARVSAVDSVKGEATYVLSRGKEKVLFELGLKLKLEMELLDESGALHEILTGTMHVAEVSNDELGDARMPSAKFTCDQTAWKPFFEECAKASWPSLKASLERLVEQAKQKWRN